MQALRPVTSWPPGHGSGRALSSLYPGWGGLYCRARSFLWASCMCATAQALLRLFQVRLQTAGREGEQLCLHASAHTQCCCPRQLTHYATTPAPSSFRLPLLEPAPIGPSLPHVLHRAIIAASSNWGFSKDRKVPITSDIRQEAGAPCWGTLRTLTARGHHPKRLTAPRLRSPTSRGHAWEATHAAPQPVSCTRAGHKLLPPPHVELHLSLLFLPRTWGPSRSPCALLCTSQQHLLVPTSPAPVRGLLLSSEWP